MSRAIENAVRAAESATAGKEAARVARDEAIRDAHASGARPVQLAAASGLSRSTVHAALRAGAGVARTGGSLERVATASREWRDAGKRERVAHDARSVAVAEALDSGAMMPADVRRLTGWGEARVYQVRDAGRALLAGD